MFTLRPLPVPDLCYRSGCQREPEVVLDQTARVWREFRRREVRLCMACLAEAESEVTARQRAEKIKGATSAANAERFARRGGYA